MADQKRDASNNPADNESSSARGDAERIGKGKDGSKDEDNEWLRDQVGEDHNLSGSSTYRTLPDQPEDNSRTDSPDKSSQMADPDSGKA